MRTTIVTLLSVVLFGLGWAHLELGLLLVEPLDIHTTTTATAAAAAARVAGRAGGVGIEPGNRYAGGPADPTHRGAGR